MTNNTRKTITMNRMPDVRHYMKPIMLALCKAYDSTESRTLTRERLIRVVKSVFTLPEKVLIRKHVDGQASMDHLIDLAISALRKNGLLLDVKKNSGIYTINDEIYEYVAEKKLFDHNAVIDAYKFANNQSMHSVMYLYRKKKAKNLSK